MLDVIFGENSSTPAATSLREALTAHCNEGTLYLGYPVLATAEAKVLVDALLISSRFGLIAFDLTSTVGTIHQQAEWMPAVKDKQDQIYASLFNKLNNFKELRSGRSLAVPIQVVTYHQNVDGFIQDDDAVVASAQGLPAYIGTLRGITPELLRPLNAAVQRVSTLRPQKKRENVHRDGSRGAILKRIEKEIANLDSWQNRGAIEYADGPQRIRGLAGSGKTVVLALKAAYLHARHPEWKIAVTFNSRALYQQFRDLIRRFTFDQIDDEPDWTNLQVIHAWGSSTSAGVYSTICKAYGVSSIAWQSANRTYGSRAFEGVCNELLSVVKAVGEKHLFDAVLVDEAQDLPRSFFQNLYNVVPDPKRIMWAYDDMQNLGDYEMPSARELFGVDTNGNPLVRLRNELNRPKEDIVLPVCYRNTPWSLATAHALGFGLYRHGGDMVQMFEEPSLWKRIGYQVLRGQLELGQPVTVARRPESYPAYFEDLLTPEDAVQTWSFEDEARQYDFLAQQIKINLEEDELQPNDILVVLPDSWTSKSVGGKVMAALAKRMIVSHVVGVTTTRDEIFSDNSVAITHIYRAKGNEASMVYLINSQYCQSGLELSRKRNILFTAITRSRCWVRLLGVGERMNELIQEVESVRQHNYQLEFNYPSAEQIARMSRVHRDMTDAERREWEDKLSVLNEIVEAVKRGEISADSIPSELTTLKAPSPRHQ